MNNRIYRKLWEEQNGPIPKDEQGRSYEIHHINGDHSDNRLENLQMVSIQEHYDIHYAQGDYGACHLITMRMKVSPEEHSRRIGELNRKRTGEKNPFYGKTHTDEVRKLISEKNSGENHVFYGKKRPEHGAKVSRALKGRKKSPEHCKALSEAHKGKVNKQYNWKVQRGDEVFEVVNLKKFCRDNNLMFSRLYRGVDTDGYLLLGRVV